MQRAGDDVASVLLAEQVEFDHGLREFLDEERNAIGPDDDLLNDLPGKLLGAGNAFDQSSSAIVG